MANIAANTAKTRWIDGSAINHGLSAFNHWKDDFFIELAPIMLMLGFIAGTIDVLTSGGIEKIPMISTAWAIVQAIAVDGLFFAVWGKIRRFEWSNRTWIQGIALIGVGLLLAAVAALVNNILSYEELNQVSSLSQVMSNLGIDSTWFSYGRSILVIIVAVLVALFTKGHGLSPRELQETIARLTEEVTGLRSMRDGLSAEKTELQNQYTALEKQTVLDRDTIARLTEELRTATQERNELQETIARARKRQLTRVTQVTEGTELASPAQAITQERETGFVAHDNGETIAVSNGSETVYATGSHRDRIKAAMADMYHHGQDIHYPTIAQSIGVGLSTVKKYGRELKEEIVKESTGAVPAIQIAQSMESMVSLEGEA